MTFDPANRGYSAIYRDNEVNHCPGCGRTQWHIGRVTAECAFCGTALPLQDDNRAAAPTIRSFGKGGGIVRRMSLGFAC